MAPRIITVLSAPRSGSSALSRMLCFLGVRYGKEHELIGATQYNVYGHFENQGILDINEDILRTRHDNNIDTILEKAGFSNRRAGLATRNCLWSAFNRPVANNNNLSDDLRQRMIEAIQKLEHIGSPAAWKDARFCITLPLWKNYMSPVSIIIWRHPTQVAKSIEVMTGIPREYAIWLWAYYTRAAFQVAKNNNWLVIRHSDLLERPGHVAEEVVSFLKSNDLDIEGNLDKAISAIDEGEINQYEEDKPVEKPIADFHAWLQEGAAGDVPNLPDPYFSQHILPFICLARSTHAHLEIVIEQKTFLMGELKKERDKLNRIRKIPGYKAISKLLRLVNI